MASNKNQHFVPRCYLRPFTVNINNKTINLFNIDRKIFIPNAPVKNQCSGDYFYGEDLTLEKWFQGLEGEYSKVLKNIIKTGYRLNDDDRSLLKFFWLVQFQRTEAASIRSTAMIADMGNIIGGELENFRLSIREAVHTAMRTVAECSNVVDDLKLCLLRNKTSIPFITSDDPAILTNRWHLQEKRTKWSSFGLGAAGNILILPISPEILCLGYDGDVYNVPHNNGWVDIRSEQDIQSLNQHQFLNCRANIFVQDLSHSQLVLDEFIKASPFRPVVKHIIHYSVFDGYEHNSARYRVVDKKSAGDHEKALIHAQVIHAKPNMWPMQLKWRPKGVVFTNGTGLGYVRRREFEMGIYPNLRKELACQSRS